MNDTSTTHSSVSDVHFSRPTVPDFGDNDSALDESLTEELISILISENADHISQLSDDCGNYLTPALVEYVFTICIRLGVPQDIKYMALDIFDRFMNTQTLSIYDAIADSDYLNSEKFALWRKTEANLSRQLTLRIVSAIQIASKFHSFHDSLSKQDVSKCLLALGTPYTEDVILKSEVRIMEVLKFKFDSRRSPSLYMESFFKILIRGCAELLEDDDVIYHYALFTIDFCFLFRDKVFTKVLQIVHSSPNVPITTHRIRRVHNDYCLLACAAIVVGIVCQRGTELISSYIQKLAVFTTIPCQDINDAANGILQVVLDETGLQ